MDVKTYRAKTMQEALVLVRRELGPQAAVLHTREVRPGLMGWLRGGRAIEVTASASVMVPSRLPSRRGPMVHRNPVHAHPVKDVAPLVPDHHSDLKSRYRDDLKCQLADLQSMVEELCRQSSRTTRDELPEGLFRLFTDLIEADISEDLARALIARVRSQSPAEATADSQQLKAQIAHLIESDISIAGPIRTCPGERRLVALVGPTGVGKTTTIAKLAANFRLKEKLKVGLITVDTYRIAAVEQLRTYADIMDLPMEVVSTPREMRQAVARLADLDLVLMDTAGRSPKDDVRIQELKSMLADAKPDEVHLVLSAVGSAATLAKLVDRFRCVGTTALLLTKLDEATGLGNLLPLLGIGNLPMSYLTDGQSVPDDIAPAERHKLARRILGFEGSGQ